MLLRAAGKALLERRQRAALALGALTVAAALATALLGLYSDIETKLRRQFRGYGANLILAPADGRETFPLTALAEADKHGAAAPFLYAVEDVNGEPLVVARVDFRRLEPLTGYWSVDGRRAPRTGECLAGVRVAEHFGLRPGSEIEVGGARRRLAGIISTGAAEDSQVLVSIDEIGGLAGRASLIAVRVDGDRAEAARASLEAALPEADARILRAMLESEANAVLKIRGTMFLLTLLILAITALCVMNNFGAMVHERRREIGMLKALGGADGRLIKLFAAEAVMVGALGSLAGFGLGSIVAGWLGRQIFEQAAAPRLEVLPAVAGITLAVALAGVALPLRAVRRIEPAAMLRGE